MAKTSKLKRKRPPKTSTCSQEEGVAVLCAYLSSSTSHLTSIATLEVLGEEKVQWIELPLRLLTKVERHRGDILFISNLRRTSATRLVYDWKRAASGREPVVKLAACSTGNMSAGNLEHSILASLSTFGMSSALSFDLVMAMVKRYKDSVYNVRGLSPSEPFISTVDSVRHGIVVVVGTVDHFVTSSVTTSSKYYKKDLVKHVHSCTLTDHTGSITLTGIPAASFKALQEHSLSSDYLKFEGLSCEEQRVRSWGEESNLGTVLAYTNGAIFKKVDEVELQGLGSKDSGGLDEYVVISPLFDVVTNGVSLHIAEAFDLKTLIIEKRWRGDCKVLLKTGEYRLSQGALKCLLFDLEVESAIVFKEMLEKAIHLLVKEKVVAEWIVKAGRIVRVNILELLE